MKCFDEVEIKFDEKMKKQVLIQRFDDGTEARTVLDTNAEFYSVLKEELRKEHNESRKYRYWVNASLDDFEYEGEIFADNDTPVSFINSQEEEEVDITDFLDSLTEVQRRRLSYRMENPKITFREMAEKEHAAVSSIHETFKQIAKLFEKFQFSTRTN